jgi:hypothetical protein
MKFRVALLKRAKIDINRRKIAEDQGESFTRIKELIH